MNLPDRDTTDLTEEETHGSSFKIEATVKEEQEPQQIQFSPSRSSEDVSLGKDEHINPNEVAPVRMTRSSAKKRMTRSSAKKRMTRSSAKKRMTQSSTNAVETTDQEEKSQDSELLQLLPCKSSKDIPLGEGEEIKEESEMVKEKVKNPTEVASVHMTRSRTKELKNIGEEPEFQCIVAKNKIRAKSIEVPGQEAEEPLDTGHVFQNLGLPLVKENMEKPLEETPQQDQGFCDIQIKPEGKESPTNTNNVAMQEVQETQDMFINPEGKVSFTYSTDVAIQESPDLSLTPEMGNDPEYDVKMTVQEGKELNLSQPEPEQDEQQSQDMQFDPEENESSTYAIDAAVDEVHESGFVVVQEEEQQELQELNLLSLEPTQEEQQSVDIQIKPEAKETPINLVVQVVQESRDVSLTSDWMNDIINDVKVKMQEEEKQEQNILSFVQEKQGYLDVQSIPEQKESPTYAINVAMQEIQEPGHLSLTKFNGRTSPVNELEMTMPEGEQKELSLTSSEPVPEEQGSLDPKRNKSPTYELDVALQEMHGYQDIIPPTKRRNSFKNEVEVAVQEEELQELNLPSLGLGQEEQGSPDFGFVAFLEEERQEQNLTPSESVKEEPGSLAMEFNFKEKERPSYTPHVSVQESQETLNFTDERRNVPVNEEQMTVQDKEQQEINLPPSVHVQEKQGSLDIQFNHEEKESPINVVVQCVPESWDLSLTSERRNSPTNEVEVAMQEIEEEQELSLPTSEPVQEEQVSWDMQLNLKALECHTYAISVQGVPESGDHRQNSPKNRNVNLAPSGPVQEEENCLDMGFNLDRNESPKYPNNMALQESQDLKLSPERMNSFVNEVEVVTQDEEEELNLPPSGPGQEEQWSCGMQFNFEGQESPTYDTEVGVLDLESGDLTLTSERRTSSVNTAEMTGQGKLQQEPTPQPPEPVQGAVCSAVRPKEFLQESPTAPGHSKGKPPLKRIVLKLHVPATKEGQKRKPPLEQSHSNLQYEFKPTYRSNEIFPVGKTQIKGKPNIKHEHTRSLTVEPPAHVTRSYTKKKRMMLEEPLLKKNYYYNAKKRTGTKPVSKGKSRTRAVKVDDKKRKSKGKVPKFEVITKEILEEITADIPDEFLEEYIIKNLRDKPLRLLDYNEVCELLKELEQPPVQTSSHLQELQQDQKLAEPSQSFSLTSNSTKVILDDVLDFTEDYVDSDI